MSEYTQAVCHDGAAILKDGVPLTVEQILEALRERDAMAAHVERQSELLRRLVSAMRNYEMDADPDYPPPRDHRAMMSDAEAALKAVPETSLARLIAESRIEGALAVRHLTQGDDWEDTELRAVIDDYVAGLRCQTEGHQ